MSSSNSTEEDSERMNETAHLKDHLHFSYYGAALIVCSILTYLADIALDSMVAISYFSKGQLMYSLTIILLILIPAICVQIFSVRWLQMDLEEEQSLSGREIGAHLGLVGIIYRYAEALGLGLKARQSGSPLDYQLYYHKQSDVSMLRLFDSFMESAPQLVFHLYILIQQSQWEVGLATWTAFSALGSLVSLGSGIASYSSSMRMINSTKGKLSWTGMILQTIWRASMLSSRIVALTLLCVALHRWALLVIFLHWLAMTMWVIYQDTDFCPTLWEERFYNAIVGVIYVFCFFNLKEGRSRYRASIFYFIIIAENLTFLGVFYWTNPREMGWMGLGAGGIVLGGTTLGILCMLIYYGYFHPGGKIRLCVQRESYDFQKPEDASSSPDFVIQDSKYATPSKVPPSPPITSEKPKIQHSRSFKNPCPPKRRFSPKKPPYEQDIESPVVDKPDSAYGTDSSINRLNETEHNASTTNNETYMSIEKSVPMAASTVLEDNSSEAEPSYMAILRPDNRPSSSSSSGVGHNKEEEEPNNETYMSLHSPVIINSSQESNVSNESLITVINRKNTLLARSNAAANKETLLKRSPVVKDITSGYAQISPTERVVRERKRDFTIIVPPIPRLKRGDLPPSLPPKRSSVLQAAHRDVEEQEEESWSPHDYENMALVNINRGTLGHWRSYSDMASCKHDDSSSSERKPVNNSSSTDYESMHYYDVYPLSRKLQDKLVKNLAPSSPGTESDTYEPIEVFEPGKADPLPEDDDYELRVPVPITLIHHDGEKVVRKRVMSMENLKDVIAKHETVPMDDPQDRSDLYLLAPMRILEPILEESEPGDLSSNNKSIMTVLSDFLNKTYASSSSSVYATRFVESAEPSSSLVQTIEEIRNQSLYSLESVKPKIPPRQEAVPPDPHRDKKVPISTSVGSRKNILDLAGSSTANLLNTPSKKSSVATELALSPSVKYDDSSTPTPPPFSRHVQNRAPCRRKVSITREQRPDVFTSTALRPDEKYDHFLPPTSTATQRGSWNASSLQPRLSQQRNANGRRSMSILDDKENEGPPIAPPKPPVYAKRLSNNSPLSSCSNGGFRSSSNSQIYSQDV